MIRRITVATLAVLVAVLVPAAPAFAHNRLTSSAPAEGAQLDTVPAEIVLTFAESLNPAYTQVIVTDATKTRVATSDPVVDGPKATITFTGTPTASTYTVAYRVVSKDGHPVQGSYPFTLTPTPTATSTVAAPASAAPASAAPASAATPTELDPASASASTPAENGSPSALIVFAAIAAVATLGGGTAFLLSRRRKPTP